MEDLKVTANAYDFKPAQAAMQRYVDNNLLSGISWAVMVGRDLVDVNCVGWADKEAQVPLRTDHVFRVFSNTKLVTSCAVLLLVAQGHGPQGDPPLRDLFIPTAGVGAASIALGLSFGLLSFAGFEQVATLGEEARKSRFTIPRVLIGTVLGAG